MLDVPITQGSYWGGAQIPYWIYLILVILPFTGFGIDHLVLRSPLTSILKFLSIIPLFGFWYFYDIAQACGERELIEKYGIGVPFYGPVGIGQGIFSQSDRIKEGPTNIPRPWLFVFYALTTLIFIAFPINKFVIGDYVGGITQFLMYISIIFIPVAIAQGIYDIYNLLFDTKGLFENGHARFPVIPAALIGGNFNNSVLGPSKSSMSDSPFGLVGTVAKIVAVEGTRRAIDSVIEPVKAVGTVIEGAAAVATGAEAAAKATVESVEAGAKATGELTNLVGTLPGIIDKVITDIPDKVAEQTLAKAIQKGGSSSPSTTIIALLFSVSLLAFSGYVFYIYKNTFKSPEKSDDPPRESRAVREPFKSGK